MRRKNNDDEQLELETPDDPQLQQLKLLIEDIKSDNERLKKENEQFREELQRAKGENDTLWQQREGAVQGEDVPVLPRPSAVAKKSGMLPRVVTLLIASVIAGFYVKGEPVVAGCISIVGLVVAISELPLKVSKELRRIN